MTPRRLQWIAAFLTVLCGAVLLAQNPVSISVIGPSTAITTTIPVSGTVTANQGSANATAWLVTGTGGVFPVTGTFWQATQPVSGTFWQTTQPVSGTFWQATQPISAASLPLPTGAAADSSLTTIDTDLKANITLHAGTNIIGKTTTDQTTHGTTDLVAADVTKYGGVAIVADPCQANAHSYVSINQTTTTQILTTAGSAKKYYICTFHLTTATAQNIAVIDSTTGGNACATSPAGSDGFGGSTAATGWNLAANGGIALISGAYAVGASHNTNAALCIAQSSTGQVSGGFSYVVQ